MQGNDAHIENHGSVHTTGGFFDPTPRKPLSGDEVFSEGIFAQGDRFYIANHGTVRAEGESASGLIGIGADGLIVNFGLVESTATESSVVFVGDGSQFINHGQVISSGEDNVVVFAFEDASVVNHGEILVTGDRNAAVQGVATNTQLENRGVIRVSADNCVGMIGGGDGHQVSNFGLIETDGTFAFGMAALGGGPLGLTGLDLEVRNAGHIATEGDAAVGIALGFTRLGFFPATGGEIVNSGVVGTVGGGAAGVAMTGDDHQLTNSGRITTDGGAFESAVHGELHAAAVLVSGDDALVKNTETGVIESLNADSAAVELNVLKRSGINNAGTSSQVENSGLIEGANVAILGGSGQETVVNHGSIVGDVVLGDGADTFVFGSDGSLDGDLFLGGGKDLVVIEDGAGTTKIADFVAGPASGDTINVSAFEFESFADVVNAAQPDGSDLVIRLDENDQVVLSNVSLNDLHESDFILMA